jgi:hypothetical protein
VAVLDRGNRRHPAIAELACPRRPSVRHLTHSPRDEVIMTSSDITPS